MFMLPLLDKSHCDREEKNIVVCPNFLKKLKKKLVALLSKFNFPKNSFISMNALCGEAVTEANFLLLRNNIVIPPQTNVIIPPQINIIIPPQTP